MLQPKDTGSQNEYKNKAHIYAVYKTPTSDLGTHTDWKWGDGKRYSMQMEIKKKAGVTILISDKIDFKIKNVTRDKKGNYTMNKGSIQEEDITIINIYAPNIGAPQHIRQILTDIKGDINSSTIIVGDVNTPLTSMDRSSRQKISKETQALNNTLINNKWT